MKQKDVYMLDDDDEKAIQLFVKLGMPKNMAKTLLHLSQVPECKSVDIERSTSMRQPEVSNMLQELRKRGWVKKHDLKRIGKGRPIHIYKSAIELSEILKIFEQKKTKEFEGIEKEFEGIKKEVAECELPKRSK